MPAGFAFDHWPYSLALVVPFLLAAAGYAVWEWRRDRRADRLAERDRTAVRTTSGRMSSRD